MKHALVLGIDIRDGRCPGGRCRRNGTACWQMRVKIFPWPQFPGLPAGYLEQYPQDWWDTVQLCLRQVVAELRKRGHSLDEIVAGAVDSTSGAIVLLDEKNQPLRPAILANDRRAQAEAEEVNTESEELRKKLGFRFDASFALPKILWLLLHEPENWRKTRHVVNATDYIVGKLTGVFNITDQNDSLKTRFNLIDFVWPAFIESRLGIDERRLPRVIRSGETIGQITKNCVEVTGLAETTRIVAGMTRTGAIQNASGARHIGDWNTLLGSPIVFTGLTKHLLIDPLGRVYSYLHPLGYWMPSGKSNVNARLLDKRFPNVKSERFQTRGAFIRAHLIIGLPTLR